MTPNPDTQQRLEARAFALNQAIPDAVGERREALAADRDLLFEAVTALDGERQARKKWERAARMSDEGFQVAVKRAERVEAELAAARKALAQIASLHGGHANLVAIARAYLASPPGEPPRNTDLGHAAGDSTSNPAPKGTVTRRGPNSPLGKPPPPSEARE